MEKNALTCIDLSQNNSDEEDESFNAECYLNKAKEKSAVIKDSSQEDIETSEIQYLYGMLLLNFSGYTEPYLTSFFYNFDKKEELSPKITEQLKKIRIKLPFEVPEVHQLETHLTKTPGKLYETYSHLGFGIKKGVFSSEEDEIIKENWISFCNNHNFDPTNPLPFLNFYYNEDFCMSYDNRRKFVQYLAHRLNERTLYHVYRRFQVLLSNKRKGWFTSHEDKAIIEYEITHYPFFKTYKPLAKLLNRSSRSIYKRRDRLCSSNKNLELPKLDDQFYCDFIRHLLVITKKTLPKLNGKRIPMWVWYELSGILGITPLKLRILWYVKLHNELFASDAEEPLRYDNILHQIFKLILKSKYDEWKEVDWKKLSKPYSGLSSLFIYVKVKGLFYRLSREKRETLQSGVAELCKNWRNYVKEPLILKKLKYENGKFEYVNFKL